MDNTKPRLDALQILRAAAFIAVVAAHCNVYLLARLPVPIFLVLSGFTMKYSYNERTPDSDFISCFKFGIKKIKPLYALHIIMLFVCMLMYVQYIIASPKAILPVIGKWFVLDALLVQAWIPDLKVILSLNGPTWYLSAALFIYILFPFIHKHLGKIKKKSSLIIGVLVSFLVPALVSVIIRIITRDMDEEKANLLREYITYSFPMICLFYFTAGYFVSGLFLDFKEKWSMAKASVIEIITVLVVGVWSYTYIKFIVHTSDGSFWSSIVVMPLSILLVHVFAHGEGIISKLLVNKVVMYLAAISGVGYLIHYPFCTFFDIILSKIIGDKAPRWLLFAVTFIIVVLLSQLYMSITNRAKRKKA